MLTIVDAYSTPPGNWKVRNEADNILIQAGTMDSLWRAWAAHRRAKEQPALSLDEMQDTFCKQLPPDCPTCGQPQINPWIYPDLVEWRKVENMPVDVWGKAGWITLHRHQITGDKSENERWLAAFVLSIPCAQGPRYCRQHFQEYLTQHPADFSSQESFFRWGWAAHEDTNKRLGKVGMTLEEAKSRYLASILQT